MYEHVAMHSVTSSNIDAIGHDPDTNTLVVEFKGGARYKYSPITEEAYIGFSNAPSQGIWFSKNIRGNEDIDFEKI